MSLFTVFANINIKLADESRADNEDGANDAEGSDGFLEHKGREKHCQYGIKIAEYGGGLSVKVSGGAEEHSVSKSRMHDTDGKQQGYYRGSKR